MTKLMGVCLLATSCLPGQITATFSPQPPDPRLPSITIWAVSVCQPAQQALSISGGLIYKTALGHFAYVQASEVRRLANARRRRSAPYILSIVAELGAWGATAALATDALKIKEQIKTLIPTGAAGLDLGRRLLSREFPVWELPGNVLQPWVALPPSGCAEAVLFGREQQGEVAFSVEVK